MPFDGKDWHRPDPLPERPHQVACPLPAYTALWVALYFAVAAEVWVVVALATGWRE